MIANVYSMSETKLNHLSGVFKLLGNKLRLRILLELLTAKELHVTQLSKMLGQMQPTISHQLSRLAARGLVGVRRDGKHSYYFITSPSLRAILRQATTGCQ